ncbi:uncharacterized protein LOC111920881 [Lactuca sativa]|uniref:uncharacterized protein LOC111920881 n=1 Tax=Lactuca sativa TaxID=4236 RepID=UPI000CC301A8|nr:uncharacterized protein LOC111920881 [Lactuca sativa]
MYPTPLLLKIENMIDDTPLVEYLLVEAVYNEKIATNEDVNEFRTSFFDEMARMFSEILDQNFGSADIRLVVYWLRYRYLCGRQSEGYLAELFGATQDDGEVQDDHQGVDFVVYGAAAAVVLLGVGMLVRVLAHYRHK